MCIPSRDTATNTNKPNQHAQIPTNRVIAENPLASAAAKRTNQTKMGGCASKDKKDKVVENETAAGNGEAGADGGDTANGGGEGCVSNSMVFLSR